MQLQVSPVNDSNYTYNKNTKGTFLNLYSDDSSFGLVFVQQEIEVTHQLSRFFNLTKCFGSIPIQYSTQINELLASSA